jgi:splicing factor U2AF 35 kDa subunit
MADRLARIFGTEEDKVNCPFYYKIGACRHGERCSRVHMKPNFSQTVLIPHMYSAPPPGPDGQPVDDMEQFEEFYEEIMEELQKFGEIDELNVVENLGDHMFGNVYCKFTDEEMAEQAMKTLNGRFYGGRALAPEYSPVTDFREARCRQFDEEECRRGGYCNFMHLKRVPRDLRKKLRKPKKRSRSRSGKRSRRSRSTSRDRGSSSSSRRDSDRGSSRSEGSGSGARSDSAERRAKIAMWNKQRESSSAVVIEAR